MAEGWHAVSDKNNLNLRVKTESVLAGAEATIYEYVRLLLIWPRNQTYSFEHARTVTDSVFSRRFRLFLALTARHPSATKFDYFWDSIWEAFSSAGE